MSKKFLEKLPEKFVEIVIKLCGQKGEKWLDGLPETINLLENKWQIKVESHFQNLSYNYVAKCVGLDGKPKVLKIALPLREVEVFNEAKTLQKFDGKGAVKVLNISEKYQAILLERLLPGKHLMDLFTEDKNKSVDVAIDLMKKLYNNSPTQNKFTDVDYWLYKLPKAEETGYVGKCLAKARVYFENLNTDKTKLKFIHGDLHHENILSVGNNDFKAIDPFGMNANVGYEIGLFLRNHLKWLNDEALLLEAIERFAEEFDFSVKEVKQWTYVQHVLSASWDFEDGSNNWKNEFELVETWERI